MSHRKEVLRLANIPDGLDEIGERLGALSESFHAVREKAEAEGQNVDKLNADYTGIHDLWTNLDLARGETTIVEARDNDVKTDPLTQLKLAGQYGVLDKDVANGLQREFNEKVRKIVGHDLSPRDIKRLHALMVSFNPFQPK